MSHARRTVVGVNELDHPGSDDASAHAPHVAALRQRIVGLDRDATALRWVLGEAVEWNALGETQQPVASALLHELIECVVDLEEAIAAAVAQLQEFCTTVPWPGCTGIEDDADAARWVRRMPAWRRRLRVVEHAGEWRCTPHPREFARR